MHIPPEILGIAKLATHEYGDWKHAHNAICFESIENSGVCASASNGYVGISCTWNDPDWPLNKPRVLINALELLELHTLFPKTRFRLLPDGLDHVCIRAAEVNRLNPMISQKFRKATGKFPDVRQICEGYELVEREPSADVLLNITFLKDVVSVLKSVLGSNEQIKFKAINSPDAGPVSTPATGPVLLLTGKNETIQVRALVCGIYGEDES